MDPLTQLNTTLEGRYVVEREVGAGGMATVYLARDLRHDRHVALKVLKPELGAVLGVERFLAEIKVTANLQHPNLLPLFDSGEANGLLFYVMPFVDGETLRARLEREKQLPVDEAIAIARAIASALDYAHSAHVIHRDLKPENILFQAGQPVLADFGIALAVANAGGARITQTGLSLGTPQYMSPEQATGDRTVDGRTDLYSLAAVLYEMLTGEPPHTGATAQAIIARVITDKPRSVRSTRDTVPPHVEAAIERALAKLPADRFTTTREFAQALGSGTYSTAAVGSAGGAQNVQFALSIPKAKLMRLGKLGAVGAAVIVGVWGWLRKPVEVRAPRMRFTLEVPDSLAPASQNMQQSIMISPDGSELVYPSITNGGNTLVRRRLDDFAAAIVPDSRDTQNPRYSSDGTWLSMELAAGNRIFKVPLAGGPSVRIAESGARNSWGDNGTIVFARENTLWTVPDAGGTPTSLTRLDSAAGDVSHQWPHVLPGSKGVLFEISSRGGNVDTDELAVATLPDGKITRLGIRGSNPRYVRSGHLLFTRQDGTVSAIPFDLRRMRVSGAAVTVLDNIVVKTGGAGMYSVSNTGTLAYIEGGSSFMVGLLDRTGRVTRLTRTNGRYFHARIDPSGERVAVALRDGTTSDVWILSLRTSEMFRLTRDGSSRSPEWIAGGAEVAWIHSDSTRDEIRAQAANGGGSPHTIQTKFTSILELAAAPRGDALAAVGGITGQRSIALVSVTGATPERQLIDAGYGVYAPSISPDGRWIAFTGTVSGRSEIFVASIANPAERLQVSTNSGFEPVWAPDGRSLTYRVANRFVSAALSFLPAFEVARRDTVLVDSFNSASAERSYDVDRRTGQWLITKQGDATRDRIVVVTGWLDELKERMASAGRR